MSNRLPKPGNGFQARRVFTIAGAHAIHDTFTAFLPLFVTTLAISKTEAGLLDVTRQIPWLLIPFLGHMVDRFRTNTVMIFAPAVTAAAMTLLGIAPSYGVLLILLLVSGASSAGLHAVGPVQCGSSSGLRIGLGMGLWMVGGELGRTIGPLIFPPSVQILGIDGLPWLMIGGILASIFLYFNLGLSDKHVLNNKPPLPWRGAIRGMKQLLLPLVGISMLRAFLLRGLTFYLPTYIREDGGSLWLAGIALACLEGAGVAGALLGGGISDHIGRRLTLAISLVATPILLFLFLASSGWVSFALLLGMGFTGLSVTPIMLALVQDTFTTNKALANGVYIALSSLTNIVAVFLMGLFSDLYSLGIAFPASALLALLALPLVRYLPKRVRP